MANEYGFYREIYPSGKEIDTLMTGNGRAKFSDIYFAEDKMTSIGIGYGEEAHKIGEIIDADEGKLAYDIGVKWQVKFECVASIDSMIQTLQRCRARQIDFDRQKQQSTTWIEPA